MTKMTMVTEPYQLPSPRGTSPLRRPNSIRRTSTMEVTWDSDRDSEMSLHGIGRDIFTAKHNSQPAILQTNELWVRASADMTILDIHSDPIRTELTKAISVHGIRELRRLLDPLLASDKSRGTPLYLLLHDVTSCLIVSNWAWDSRKEALQPEAKSRRRTLLAGLAGACTGFSPESSALQTDGSFQAAMASQVAPMPHPDDPDGWHSVNEPAEVSLRRARRIDLWVEHGNIFVESTFQDSATTESGDHRLAVHEYSVAATFDAASRKLMSLDATPHILPFPECPGAIAHIRQLVGTPAEDLSATISRELRKTAGCTHLNDAIRALAEVPALLAAFNKQTKILPEV